MATEAGDFFDPAPGSRSPEHARSRLSTVRAGAVRAGTPEELGLLAGRRGVGGQRGHDGTRHPNLTVNCVLLRTELHPVNPGTGDIRYIRVHYMLYRTQKYLAEFFQVARTRKIRILVRVSSFELRVKRRCFFSYCQVL